MMGGSSQKFLGETRLVRPSSTKQGAQNNARQLEISCRSFYILKCRAFACAPVGLLLFQFTGSIIFIYLFPSPPLLEMMSQIHVHVGGISKISLLARFQTVDSDWLLAKYPVAYIYLPLFTLSFMWREKKKGPAITSHLLQLRLIQFGVSFRTIGGFLI